MKAVFTLVFFFFGVLKTDVPDESVFLRLKTVMAVLKIHSERGEMPTQGFLYYLDPAEYIPPDESLPRLGSRRGDDNGISVQRLIYKVSYNTEAEKIVFNIESFYPARTGRLGFGFRKRSGKTPTGFYFLGDNYLSPVKYQNLSSSHPGEITTGKILLVNIMRNGRSIYEETRGQNNPLLRGVIVHGFGLSQDEEKENDEGSRGCVHVTADGIIDMVSTLRHNRGRVLIFISGASFDFSDLPVYEKTLFDSLIR
ncbi:L,D-transpeptidase [candidate division WOR-3 bacterium]|nr:L,D-transpeptidase [candidate division WOR-3 bacterium]